jgi:glycerol-3-phosphate acyltransferase PlsY
VPLDVTPLGILLLLAAFVVAFFLGSIPWGLIVSHLFYRTDIREYGSGNIGTANALRTLGKRGGGAVFALDFGKGLLAGAVALLISLYLLPLMGLPPGSWPPREDFLTTALLGCTLGHIFSPWLKFRGGKGIAVAVGCVFITFGWLGALIELGIFIVIVILTRYVSLGSIAAAVACPVMGLWLFWDNWLSVAFCAAVGLVIIWAHRGNIKRLMEGTEHRLGDKKA